MDASNFKVPVRLNAKAYASLAAMAERRGYKPSAFAQLLFFMPHLLRVSGLNVGPRQMIANWISM